MTLSDLESGVLILRLTDQSQKLSSNLQIPV